MLSRVIKKGIVRAKVFNRINNAIRFIELEYFILEYPNREIAFQLIDGPTGYEGFYIEEGERERYIPDHVKCWVACMGTNHVYDRLEIPKEEMIKALEGI